MSNPPIDPAKMANGTATWDESLAYVRWYFTSVDQDPVSRYHEITDILPPRPCYALDYGCGWGYMARQLARLNYRVHGIDLDDSSVRIAQALLGDNPMLRFDAQRITDLPDKEYELVISNQVIEHTHNPGSYLSGINRVLKPDGHLVISIPNIMNPRFAMPLASPKFEQNLKKISTDTLSNYQKVRDHIQSWDPTHFVRLVSSVGFELEQFKPTEGIPMPWWRWIPPYLRGRFARQNPYVRNFSYTMCVRFRKVRDVSIGQYD